MRVVAGSLMCERLTSRSRSSGNRPDAPAGVPPVMTPARPAAAAPIMARRRISASPKPFGRCVRSSYERRPAYPGPRSVSMRQTAGTINDMGNAQASPLTSALHLVRSLRRQPSIVAIDGRSSSGKTTLAARIAAAVPDSRVVHTDDIAWHHAVLDWAGLLADGVLRPFRSGRTVSYRPPQWDRHG